MPDKEFITLSLLEPRGTPHVALQRHKTRRTIYLGSESKCPEKEAVARILYGKTQWVRELFIYVSLQ